MKGTAVVFIAIIIAFLFASGCISAPADPVPSAKTPGPQHARLQYVIGVDSDYPPFSYRDRAGNLTGFDIESARWIADRQGFNVEFVAVPWDRIIPALKAGSIDMIYSGMTITPGREQDVNFTRSYYTANLSIAIRQGSRITMEDLYSGRFRIGAQAGSTGAAWAEENLVLPKKMPAANLVLFPDISTLTRSLANGTIDASIHDSPAQWQATAGTSLTLMGDIPTQEHYAVAVRKTDPELLILMDDGLRQLMEDPTWQQREQKYGLVR
jgi:polar amino acid transport system substrate-binding protein